MKNLAGRTAIARAALEPLETRRMFSTITWDNRNTFTGANDNRFDDVFGSLANQAIAVVDAAIAVWQRTIVSFNYGTGTDTYNLSVTMNPANPPLGNSNTAGSANGGFSSTVNGKPKSGSMGLGWNSGSPPSGDTAGGWYLDPTPNESSEFQGAFHNAFVREPTNITGIPDLFSVVMHELGHCMGLGANNATRAVSVDTNDPDTVSPPAVPPTPPITLWTYNGNESLWTEFDSGGAAGGGPGNFGGPQHFAPNLAIALGGTRTGAVALMNSATPWRATLSDLEADCLRLAFGYSIQKPSRFGTTYAQLDANGTLRINTSSLRNDSNDVVVIDENFGAITVSLTLGNRVVGIDPIGTFTSEFPGSSVQRIDIDTGTGNDTIHIESKSGQIGTVNAGEGNDIIHFGFTDRNLSNIAGSTDVRGGGGSDQVYAWDNVQATPHTYSITSFRFDRPGWGGFFYHSDVEFLNLTSSSAADTVNVQSTFTNQPVFLFSAGGTDTVNIGNSTNGVRGISGEVTVHNDPSLTTLNINNGPDTGARTWNVDGVNNFGYLVGMAPARIYWDNADISSINLTCGSGVDTGQFVISTETFNLNNSGGNDFIRIGVPAASGLQLLSGQITIDNTPATTTLSIDDTGSSIARTITIDEAGGYNTVSGMMAGLIRFDNADANATIITSSASDTVNVIRNDDTLVINSSGGNDTVNLGNTTNGVQLITGEVTVRNTPSTSTLNINNGPDTVARTAALQNLTVGADILGQWTGLAPGAINYRYLDVSTINVTFGSAADSILLRQSQKDLNLTTTGGIDAYAIGGASNGAQSILGNITLQNPPSRNNFHIDNLGDTTARTATLDDVTIGGAAYGQLTGLAPATISWKHADTTGVTLTGGSGADRFFVNRFKGGLNLSVFGGNGNDQLHFGNGNLAANIAVGTFNFDGQGGSADEFVINNTSAPAGEQWNYGVDGPSVSASRVVGGVFNLVLSKQNVEHSVFNGNSGNENMVITAVPAGQSFAFNGGAGGDSVFFPTNVSTAIRGLITLDGGAGPGNVISQTTNDSTAATTLHVTANTIGAFAGDNFFGAGGSVQYSNFNSAVLTLGSGADTVYVRPNTTAALNVRGGNPGAAPGDRLNFGLAGVSGPVFSGNAANGNLTSSNFARVDYSFFETGPTVDSTAPAGQSASAPVNGVPPTGGGAPRFAVDVAFNDNVAGLLTGGSLSVFNLNTELTVPAANIAAEYIASSNTARFMFPGYPNGSLPDGNYQATVSGNLTDLFGNPLAVTPGVSFYVFAGDANRDRSINIGDFSVLGARFNQPGTFTQGDFNYSGQVEIGDFSILASKFNTTLPAPRPLAPPSAAPTHAGFSKQRIAPLFETVENIL